MNYGRSHLVTRVRKRGAELLVSKLDRLSRDLAMIANLMKEKDILFSHSLHAGCGQHGDRNLCGVGAEGT